MRELISVSPVAAYRSRFNSLTRSRSARCSSGVTPAGLDKYRTGSPLRRNITPWYADGRNPLDHCADWLMFDLPVLSTTKPGRFFDSLPSPYCTHAPIVGRPGSIWPASSNISAGWWLNASVCMERTKHKLSTIGGHFSLRKSLNTAPLLPYWPNVRGLPRIVALGFMNASFRSFV